MKTNRKMPKSQPKSRWAKPVLERLEGRIVPNAALDGLKSGLPGLESALSNSFGQATSNLLSGSLPFAPLITSTVLSNQVGSVVSSVETAAGQSSSVTELFGKTGPNFQATNLQEAADGSTASFDLQITADMQAAHTLSVLTNQNIHIGPFSLSLNPGSGAQLNIDDNFTITTHVTVSAAGLSITAGATTVQYTPTVDANSVAKVTGTVGGVTFSGSVGLVFSPTITASFQVNGTINPSQLTNATATIANTKATIPFEAVVVLNDVGTFTYDTSLTYDLKSGQSSAPGSSDVLYTAPGSSTPVLLQQDGQAVNPDDVLIQNVLKSAGDPIFKKLGSLIPQDVVDFLNGNTQVEGVSISTLLGGETPLTLLGIAADAISDGAGTPLVAVISDLIQAVQFAHQIDGMAPEQVESYGKVLGLTFPILANPVDAITKILEGQATTLVKWDVNAVDLMNNYLMDNHVPQDVVDKLDAKYAPDGKTIKIDVGNLNVNKEITSLVADYLKHFVGDRSNTIAGKTINFIDAIQQALDGIGNPLSLHGQFSLLAHFTIGIDSSFLQDPSIQGIENSFFLDSGNLIDFQVDNFGFDVPFGSSGGGLGLSWNDVTDKGKQILTNPGQAGQDILNSIRQGGDGAANTIANGITATGQFIERGIQFVTDYLPAGEVAATVSGEFTVCIPPGSRSDHNLNASDVAQLPQTLEIGSNISLNATVVLKLGSTPVINQHKSFSVFTDLNPGVCDEIGTGGISTPIPFAEVNPTTRVLQVYGTAGSDQFAIDAGANNTVIVHLGGAYLTFNLPDFDSVFVDLRGGVLTPIHGATPVDGGDDSVIIDPALSSSLTVRVWGGSGTDFFTAADGNGGFFGGTVVFFAGHGDTTMVGGAGDSYLYGDSGNDTLIAGLGFNLMVGGPGTNVLEGPNLASGATPTTASGGIMVGGSGFDLEYVGNVSLGPWTLIGGNIFGGADANSAILVAGQGNTTLIAGDALLFNNQYTGLPGTGQAALLIGGPGNDVLYGGAGTDTLIGGGFNTSVASGNDIIFAGDADSTIVAGNATLDSNGHIIADTTTPGGGMVFGGAGQDIIYAGVGANKLIAGAGPATFIFSQPSGAETGAPVSYTVAGGPAYDTLDFTRTTSNLNFTLTGDDANGFSGFTPASAQFAGTFSGIDSLLGSASTGSDTLTGENVDSRWDVTTGTFYYTDLASDRTLDFANFQNLTGGAGNDRFVIQTGASLGGRIDGGGGINTLDYSAYSGNVVVDLDLNLATAIGQGVYDIQNVTGSIGNDLLVGDAHANVLIGGTGRNVIIGAGGPDTLVGGGGDNIMIGGFTSYDQNLTALCAIMAEWDRTDLSFEQRLAHLISNGQNDDRLNGSFVLNKKTVFSDGASDTIVGGSALDWVFMDGKTTTLADRKPRDHITEL